MRIHRGNILSLLLLLFLTLAACKTSDYNSSTRTTSQTKSEEHVRTELFFGLAIPTGGSVSEIEWKDFLDREITPRFPEGLTILDASGQFLMQDKTLSKEPVKIVVILHPAGEAADSSIEMIRAAYIKRFRQESVLRVSSPVGISF
jgi:hypothetical protein